MGVIDLECETTLVVPRNLQEISLEPECKRPKRHLKSNAFTRAQVSIVVQQIPESPRPRSSLPLRLQQLTNKIKWLRLSTIWHETGSTETRHGYQYVRHPLTYRLQRPSAKQYPRYERTAHQSANFHTYRNSSQSHPSQQL